MGSADLGSWTSLWTSGGAFAVGLALGFALGSSLGAALGLALALTAGFPMTRGLDRERPRDDAELDVGCSKSRNLAKTCWYSGSPSIAAIKAGNSWEFSFAKFFSIKEFTLSSL